MRSGRTLTILRGELVEREASSTTTTPLAAGCTRVLVERFGYSEEIAQQLPPDEP